MTPYIVIAAGSLDSLLNAILDPLDALPGILSRRDSAGWLFWRWL